MNLSSQKVEDIAVLARLSLTEEETQKYAEQLSGILGYIEMLHEVDTSTVEETLQVTGLMDVVREDVVVVCEEETRKKLLAAFPERMGNLLKVQGVFTTSNR